MNPITWLEQHPNAAVAAIVAGSILLVVFAAWVIHWYVIDARYWLAWLRRPAPVFDEEWQREPWTDDDAAQLVADLTTDLPGPASAGPDQPAIAESWAGELHLEPWLFHLEPDLERTLSYDERRRARLEWMGALSWDAGRAADRCWEILHVEFPRLRAELAAA